MGYLMMYALSTRARQCDRVVRLLRMVMRPPEPVANERAGRRRAHAASWTPRLRPRWRLDARWIIDTLARRHAAVDLARPGMANGHPADQATRKRLELSRTMWAVEHELQEPRAEGRAIDRGGARAPSAHVYVNLADVARASITDGLGARNDPPWPRRVNASDVLAASQSLRRVLPSSPRGRVTRGSAC